jgi:FkbM family methyltransferase
MDRLTLTYLRHFPIPYGKSSLSKRVVLPEEKLVYKNALGTLFMLDTKDYVMKQIYLFDIYEKNTVRHILKFLKPTDLFVDIGANIGAYSIIMATRLPQGRVISFEPNKRAASFLEQNIELNGLQNMTIEPFGLSDKKETAIMYSYTAGMTTASFNKGFDSPLKEEIPLITLDEYCDQNRIKEIDIMKIDVEGHEPKVLEGAKDVIRRSKRLKLIMEIDQNTDKFGGRLELFNSVISLGFKAYLPKAYPFGMKEVKTISEQYTDNVIFSKV